MISKEYTDALNRFEKAYAKLVYDCFRSLDTDFITLESEAFKAYKQIPFGDDDPFRIMLGDNLLKAVNAILARREELASEEKLVNLPAIYEC